MDYDYDEMTPDGRYVIRRVTVPDPLYGKTHDWYVSLPAGDRWLRYGRTTNPMPTNRYMPLDGDRAYEKLRHALGRVGQPWATVEQVPSVTEIAEAQGGVAVAITNDEVSILHDGRKS
jgi:hypothetical protein